MMEQIAAACGDILAIASAAALFLKPLRDKVFGLKDISDGVQCLLRSDMLRTYYKHQEESVISQHERQNFEAEPAAYKAAATLSWTTSTATCANGALSRNFRRRFL